MEGSARAAPARRRKSVQPGRPAAGRLLLAPVATQVPAAVNDRAAKEEGGRHARRSERAPANNGISALGSHPILSKRGSSARFVSLLGHCGPLGPVLARQATTGRSSWPLSDRATRHISCQKRQFAQKNPLGYPKGLNEKELELCTFLRYGYEPPLNERFIRFFSYFRMNLYDLYDFFRIKSAIARPPFTPFKTTSTSSVFAIHAHAYGNAAAPDACPASALRRARHRPAPWSL